MFDGSFIVPAYFDFKVLYEYKNILSMFFVWEIIITDNFF